MTMDRFKCDGWLHITLDDELEDVAVIHTTHHQNHIPYTDISISEEVMNEIKWLKDLPAGKV
jgi:hypothetical protein